MVFRRRRAATQEEDAEQKGDAVAQEQELTEPPRDDQPRISQRFGRTRRAISAPFGRLRARSRLDESAFDDLEEALLLADVGRTSTKAIVDELRNEARGGEIRDEDALELALRDAIIARFGTEDRSLQFGGVQPTVWLFVGVNGVGKTTTIGKVAGRLHQQGVEVVIAAADTFRAAATEQLEAWAQRSESSFVRGAEGADPSSVVFDAVEHASASGAQIVLCDTAGRLHTKTNLMEELKKVRRVADRTPGRVSEVLLVLDATTGQNGLVQAREFTNAVDVTGIVLTKLDGTAKGGVALAIHDELQLPIKLVGVGEGEHDLIDFDPADFAMAMIAD